MIKRLRIIENDSSKWIGGLYYKRNIIFSLIQNEYIVSNFKIQVSSYKENLKYFECFKNKIDIISNNENNKLAKMKSFLAEMKQHVAYEYPSASNFIKNAAKLTTIQWIPDFQHNHYPEYFTDDELNVRTNRFKNIRENSQPLILSSYDCLNDFEHFYGKKDNVYVVPFVSYIEPELNQLKINDINGINILDKYNLDGVDYACISNQFWQHKNHRIVLEAIKKIKPVKKDFKFVFTGYPKDYRNPDYYNSLMRLLEDPDVKPHIIILGFIDRVDQLAVMRAAKFIIQPSLFEGWGTVVEDAKVLDKRILLSDISVHREQMNSNCILFDPKSAENLAVLIEKMMFEEHHDDIQKGLKDMYRRAEEYSKGFELLLKDCEAK